MSRPVIPNMRMWPRNLSTAQGGGLSTAQYGGMSTSQYGGASTSQYGGYLPRNTEVCPLLRTAVSLPHNTAAFPLHRRRHVYLI